MIDLYSAGTANGFRASVALEEAGLPYHLHKVDLAKGEHRRAEFLKRNPAGLIPVIVDQDGPGGKPLTLSQSGAIILYAAEKTGKFLPKDAIRRAMAWQWFTQALSDVAATSGAADIHWHDRPTGHDLARQADQCARIRVLLAPLGLVRLPPWRPVCAAVLVGVRPHPPR